MAQTECQLDQYRDPGTWLCMHCWKICNPSRGLEKRCQELCIDYWNTFIRVTSTPEADEWVPTMGDDSAWVTAVPDGGPPTQWGTDQGLSLSGGDHVAPWIPVLVTVTVVVMVALLVMVGLWCCCLKGTVTGDGLVTPGKDVESQTVSLMTGSRDSPMGSGSGINQLNPDPVSVVAQQDPEHQPSGASRSDHRPSTSCPSEDYLSCGPLDLRSTGGGLGEDMRGDTMRDSPAYPDSSCGPLGSSFLRGFPQTRR